jgi:hypothetical protein
MSRTDLTEKDFGDHQCAECRHATGGAKCVAFPEGIPVEIIDERHDHRQPYPGDNGIRFEPLPGRRHPLDVVEDADD